MNMQNLIGINLIFLTNFHFISNEIQLRGKGASFPSEVYKAWMPSYKASRQNQVSLSMEYLGIGSGNGQKAIINNVDIEYAGSDSILPESTKTLYPDLIEFPTIAGLVCCKSINICFEQIFSCFFCPKSFLKAIALSQMKIIVFLWACFCLQHIFVKEQLIIQTAYPFKLFVKMNIGNFHS